MEYILTFIVSGVLLAFSGIFHQVFYMPKILVLMLGASAGAVMLLHREKISIPARNSSIFIGAYLFMLAVMSFISASPRHAFMQMLVLLNAILVYGAVINAGEKQREDVLKITGAVALLQTIFLALQAGNMVSVLPGTLLPVEGRLTGTIGNPEFLATVLAVGVLVFLHFRERTSIVKDRVWFGIGITALLLGVIVIGSKGTLIYLAFYGFWRWKKDKRLFAAGTALILILLYAFSNASVSGRLFLWLTSMRMFSLNPIAGVGLGQFENHYLQTVYGLFSSLPALAIHFGSYTSLTQDAHNIFLQHAAEMGIAGLALSAAFSVFVYGRARSLGGPLGAALLLFLYKSMYTVMLNSPTDLLLLAILLGISETPEHVRTIKVIPVWNAVVTPVLAVCILSAVQISAADYYYQRGLKAVLMGDAGAARTDFNKAVRSDPELAEPYLALAYAGFVTGDKKEMLLRMGQALERKKSMDTYKISAHMLFYSGLYDSAERIYGYLQVLFPDHLTTMAKLAAIAVQNRDYSKASMLAERILASKPRRTNASDMRNTRVARAILNKCYGGVNNDN